MKNKNLQKVFILLIFALLTSCNQLSDDVKKDDTTNGSPISKSSDLVGFATGSFSALSYNIAGLPEGISSGNPNANTSQIGTLVRNYDIVHVQEDFNYHAKLYETDNHPHRTPTSGGVPFGDGLNTLSRYPYTDFKRVKWNSCNGTDCLTPKGFTYMRIRLAAGVYVDFYNAHPNAGVTDADLAARRSNITQLSQFITANSAGNAVVLMGDFNVRYTRAGDNVREFINNNGMTDSWIRLIRNNSYPTQGSDALVCPTPPTNQCEVVDKIFFRSSKSLTLTPSNYRLDHPSFYDANGQPLSDHYPVFTNFSWATAANFQLSDLFGGPHGTPFNDIDKIAANNTVSQVSIRAGARVDRVSLTLNNGVSLPHGGSGGTESVLNLASGEHVTSVRMCSGQHNGRTRIFFIEFRTNQNRTISGGTQTSNTVTYTAPSGWKITGYYGNSGDAVDKLGVIYTPI